MGQNQSPITVTGKIQIKIKNLKKGLGEFNLKHIITNLGIGKQT